MIVDYERIMNMLTSTDPEMMKCGIIAALHHPEFCQGTIPWNSTVYYKRREGDRDWPLLFKAPFYHNCYGLDLFAYIKGNLVVGNYANRSMLVCRTKSLFSVWQGYDIQFTNIINLDDET